MSIWQVLLPAFAFSLLLIASHTYLGLHVLARGIIFVDLALAQFAALGASVAFLFGLDAHGGMARGLAFAAALAAALAFSMLHRVPSKTTREVIIGSSYVVATALSILVLSRSAQGMDELRSLFNGNILWVDWPEIAVAGAVYAGLGLFHLACRHRFAAISFHGRATARPGFLWELAFFASFAVVITLAVWVAGILVVFAFLIIPAFSASLLAGRFVARLLVGWLLGAIGSLAGLGLAYAGDLPVGPTVVAVLGILPLAAVALRQLQNRAAG